MRGGKRQRGKVGDRGLTLLELVVAMAVFALVAIMGLQSLSGMVHQRDRLAATDSETAALSRGVALLRNDLSAIVPLLFYPPGRAAPRSAVTTTAVEGGRGDRFEFSLAGQPQLDGSTAMHRVQWRLDPQSGVLSRRVWASLTPADDSAQHPEAAVLDGVQGVRLRSHWPGVGWIDGFAAPAGQRVNPQQASDSDRVAGSAEVYSDTLPQAIEVTLVRGSSNEITLIEALR